MLYNIEDGAIVVLPGGIKNKIIEEIRGKNGLKDIKFISIQDFQKQFYFTYDNQAIYYLMKQYCWKYEVCLVYLKNLYYIEDKEYSYEKLNFLRDLKGELEQKGLLVYHPFFRESLKKKKVYVIGFSYLNLYYQKMFDEVEKITSVSILKVEKPKYTLRLVYEFESLEDEVNFVAIQIVELLKKGVDIGHIKLANVSSEYLYPIIKIFGFYHIPIYLNRNISLYSTSIGQYFLSCLGSNIHVTLDKVYQKYRGYSDEYNQIVDVVNEYLWCDDFTEIYDMLVYDLKHTFLLEPKRNKQVECISFPGGIISKDDYVFLLNFNQGSIPVVHQDEEYITDRMKKELGFLESVVELNIIEKNMVIDSILEIAHLTISYKKESSSGSYIVSSLNDELKLQVVTNFKDFYCYSDLYNQLRLARDIDEFSKYGVVSARLPVLYAHYVSSFEYQSYCNQFTGIDKQKLESYLHHKLLLSYSTIDNFYRCGFRYYVGNILKLSIYEDTFMTTLGSLFHYILSLAFEKEDFDLNLEYQNYIDTCGKEFSVKEKFFLKKLKEELRFIILSIQQQMQFCSLDKASYEQQIYVDKSSDMDITFMGIVDKILYGEFGGKFVAAIVDYKTGNPSIHLNHTIYGIEMQLPVYLYLLRRSGQFSNVSIAGFYLQKVLNSEILRNDKQSYEELKRNNLKLQGYSNQDISILEKFDSEYYASKVVRGLRTTSQGFSVYSKVISDEQLDQLESIVDEKIDQAIGEIRKAQFEINPKKIGKLNYGCEFCKFKDLCFMRENDIVSLKEYKNLEFLRGEGHDTNQA